MNANTPFRSLLANRYGGEAACLCVLCGSVQTQLSQIVGLRSGQIKPSNLREKGKPEKHWTSGTRWYCTVKTQSPFSRVFLGGPEGQCSLKLFKLELSR